MLYSNNFISSSWKPYVVGIIISQHFTDEHMETCPRLLLVNCRAGTTLAIWLQSWCPLPLGKIAWRLGSHSRARDEKVCLLLEHQLRRASFTIQNRLEKYTGLHCSIGEMKQVLSPELKKISTVSSSLAGTITLFCHELKDISALACLVAPFSEFATLPCGNRRTLPQLVGTEKQQRERLHYHLMLFLKKICKVLEI